MHTTVEPAKLDRRLVGRAFDQALLDELPADVDLCGENGEFTPSSIRARSTTPRSPAPAPGSSDRKACCSVSSSQADYEGCSGSLRLSLTQALRSKGTGSAG